MLQSYQHISRGISHIVSQTVELMPFRIILRVENECFPLGKQLWTAGHMFPTVLLQVNWRIWRLQAQHPRPQASPFWEYPANTWLDIHFVFLPFESKSRSIMCLVMRTSYD